MRAVNGALRSLADAIGEMSAWSGLLREIDQEITKPGGGLPDVLCGFAVKIKDLFGAKRVGVYLVSKPKLRPFDIEKYNKGEVIFIREHANPEIPDKVKLFEPWIPGDTCHTLVIPIFWGDDKFAVIALQDDLHTSFSRLSDSEVNDYAQNIAVQLAILVQSKLDKHIETLREELVQTFFLHQLRPFACWAEIAQKVSDFLPKWVPASFDVLPRVQVLTYIPGDHYLTLCADDQTKNSGNFRPLPLRVDQTVSGLLVEKYQASGEYQLLVDPHKLADRYQSYLYDKIPQSELVLAIVHRGRITGVLNIEHPAPNAFLPIHIKILLMVARYIGPFVDALIAREQRQRAKEVSMLYVQSKLLKRMASTFRHKVGHSLLQSRFALENLEAVLVGDPTKLSVLADLRESVDQFQERSNTFLSDLPEFIFYKEIPVTKIIEEALLEFDIKGMEEEINIIFMDNTDGTVLVWASRLLREHVYNLIKNSFDAVRSCIGNGTVPSGLINISLDKEPVIDLEKRETSASRIVIKIEDNGGGVPLEYEERIQLFGFTTKGDRGGSGYGLPAALEYSQSIGGDLCFENRFPEGFIVKISLQEYTYDLHEPIKHRMFLSDFQPGEKK